LTIANTSPQVYTGSLFGGPGANQNNLSVTAGGTNSITLSGSNTYSGGSTVSPGATLALAPASFGNTPAGTGAVTLSGGTLALAGVANGSGLVGSFYISPPANVNNGNPAFNDLPTMTAHFAAGTPRVSVATTKGGKVDLNYSNNGYGGAAPFNGPNDTTTAAYGFANNVNYEATFTGYLNIVTAGSYSISTTSDDGSVAFIDGGDGTGPNGLPAVSNNMYQGANKVTSSAINLTAGLHALTVGFYQGGGGQGLLVEYNGPDTVGVDATIPNSALMLSNTAFVPSQSYPNALTVTADSTLNITNSLSASMGNASLGAAALNVTSSDATASPYSLTLGPTALTGNATINVANSTGGGAGTVTLGSVNGAFSLSKGGPGTVVLSTVGSYSGGTTISAGTVQANTPGSLGAGAVTLNNGSTLRLIANPSTVAPVVGFGGGANWTVTSNGIASPPFTGDVLTLTDGANGEERAAFYNTRVPIVYGNHGFTASFTYQDVNPPAGGGADGVTFTLQNDLRGPTAIGGGGGGLGYGADASPALIAPSVAYEINIYNGHVQGTNFVNYTTNPGTNNFINSAPVAFQGGNPINVVLAYNPVAQTLTETDTDTVSNAVYMHVYNVGDLTSLATGVGGTDAFIGITGATGGVNSTQTVTNFNYSIGTATAAENLIVSPAATATIDVTPTGSGSTVAMGTLTIGAGGTLNKTNSGTLAVNGPSNIGAGATIQVNSGGLRFTNTGGSSTVASGASANVAAGATLELAGTVSNLSDSGAATHRVHVFNNSTVASGGSLLVTGSNQQVGAIDGTGDTVVNAGASLTANHIVQNALLISGSSASSVAIVTIAASDASGNPLASSSGLSIAGSLNGDGPFGAGGQSSTSLSDAGSNSGDSGLGATASSGSSSSVPEPSAVMLAIVGALGGLASLVRRRRMTK
jgi:autotransporter-associated beta strand protein